MDILQYRTSPNAPWVGIPAIQGQKGDKGEQGQKGDKGDPGVSIKAISINASNYIVITLDDDTTITSSSPIPVQSGGISVTIVEELPQTGNANTIYMLLRTEAFLNDYYDEYMWINNAWEIIGSTRLDLSNYYNKSEIDSTLTNYAQTSALPGVATTATAGLVKPDGTTITIDNNGVISASGSSSGSNLPADPVTDGAYKLVNTVATTEGTQSSELTWEEDSGGGANYTAGAGIEIDSNNRVNKLDGALSFNSIERVSSSTDSGYENFGASWQETGSAKTLEQLKVNLLKYNMCSCYFSSALSVSDIQTMLAEIYPGHSQYIVNYYTSYTYEKFTGSYNHFNTYVSSIPRNVALIAKPYTQSPSGILNLQFIRIQDLPSGYIARSSRTSISSVPLVTDGNQDLLAFATMLRNEVSTIPQIWDYMNANTIINGMIQHTNFSHLVSTDTAPTVNNTINWVYK